MRVTVPRGSDPDVVVTVDGATETVVKDIDWGTIIDTIANVLNWDCIINIRGLPTVKASNLTINFASGGTQDIWTILTNNGWAPVQKP